MDLGKRFTTNLSLLFCSQKNGI